MGPWRVEAWHAQGTYGAVYRAVRIGHEHLGPVALKLSVNPWDARFTREAELLSRLAHPGIPQLLDRGVLRSPAGAEHPWFAMQWVDGTPLYAWAAQHSASRSQLCLLLSQLARALEALHASGAVHRDVKGDNVLVRLLDNRAVLIDFGSAHFQGASRLTWQSLPPGTPAYLSPRACLFDIRLARERNSYYAPSPADDLYALGVTAYRLVMGHYPPDLDVTQDEQGSWRVASSDVRPLLERNLQVHPLLRQWILRLLSQEPEERGSAAALAEALEAQVQQPKQVPAPASTQVSEVTPPEAPAPASPPQGSHHTSAPKPQYGWRPWLALTAAAAVALVLSSRPRPGSVSPEHVPDAGTAAGGDRAPTAPPPSKQQTVSQDPPFIPFPDKPQRARPDAKGRCQGSKQVVLNGFCWVELSSLTAEECTAGGYMHLKGKCYAPALERPQKAVPTSAPGDAR